MPQGMLPLEQSLEQFRRNHPNPKSHRPQRITKPLRDIYTRNFTREHETTPAERGAASEELLQELEFVPVSSTPAVLSRKEEFEKEVATAREELRMKRMEKNEARVHNGFEEQKKGEEERQVLDRECGDFWGDEVDGKKLDAVAEDENEEDLDLYRASEMQSSVGSEMLLDEVSGAVVGSYEVHM